MVFLKGKLWFSLYFYSVYPLKFNNNFYSLTYIYSQFPFAFPGIFIPHIQFNQRIIIHLNAIIGIEIQSHQNNWQTETQG